MGGDEYTVAWQQVRMGTTLLDRWAARITSPFVSVEFASVGLTLRHDWLLRWYPRGPGLDTPSTFHIYLTREKAMMQVGRWLHCHWRTIPAQAPPALMGGRR